MQADPDFKLLSACENNPLYNLPYNYLILCYSSMSFLS
jgi:hypothetical protein